MEGVDYVSNTYPFMSAKTWIEENGLLNIAQTKGFDDVCYRINGGWNGYEDRLAKYQICKDVL
jgi:predicted chitinase